MKRIGVICGGSGSSKFAKAIADYSNRIENVDVGFIANVADNYWFHGLYVCPDVDILVYALSGYLDSSKGWGVKSDDFLMRESLQRITKTVEWFGLGDRDSAFSLRRTELMNKGWKLSSVTSYFCKMLGIEPHVMPASDDVITTFIHTSAGKMHLQEFWVKHKANPNVIGLEHFGSDNAKPNQEAVQYLSKYAFICPANPVTSILPSIKIKKIQSALAKSRVLAISPFVGGRPFSGPAGKLMVALGSEANSFGVANLYSKFLKIMLVDKEEDRNIMRRIKDLGIECIRTNTRLETETRARSIAKEVLDLL